MRKLRERESEELAIFTINGKLQAATSEQCNPWERNILPYSYIYIDMYSMKREGEAHAIAIYMETMKAENTKTFRGPKGAEDFPIAIKTRLNSYICASRNGHEVSDLSSSPKNLTPWRIKLRANHL